MAVRLTTPEHVLKIERNFSAKCFASIPIYRTAPPFLTLFRRQTPSPVQILHGAMRGAQPRATPARSCGRSGCEIRGDGRLTAAGGISSILLSLARVRAKSSISLPAADETYV